MAQKQEEMQIFVPAQALEHPGNQEEYTLKEKIKWALIRYYLNDDFMGLISVSDRLPSVSIEKMQFDPVHVGYYVISAIRCN